jgi:hypothetical protein
MYHQHSALYMTVTNYIQYLNTYKYMFQTTRSPSNYNIHILMKLPLICLSCLYWLIYLWTSLMDLNTKFTVKSKSKGEKNLLFSSVSRLVLGSIQPHILCVTQAISPSIKQLIIHLHLELQLRMCGDIHLSEVVLMKFSTQALLVYHQSCYELTEDWLVMFLHKTSCSTTEQNWTLQSHPSSEISLYPGMHWHLSYHHTHIQ